MHNDSVVDVDEEGHPLLSAQRGQVNLLQLRSGIGVGSEDRVPLESVVVQSLAICCQVLIVQPQDEVSKSL